MLLTNFTEILHPYQSGVARRGTDHKKYHNTMTILGERKNQYSKWVVLNQQNYSHIYITLCL